MSLVDGTPVRVHWARLRFSIVSQLLASPPASGELGVRIAALAKRSWRHPMTGEWVRFSAKSIERWYYTAKSSNEPIVALTRKVPKHVGTFPSFPAELQAALDAQYRAQPSWHWKLHYDNLLTVAKQQPSLGKMPSYATVTRYMQHKSMIPRRRKRRRGQARGRGAEGAEGMEGVEGVEGVKGQEPRERRSFEVSHVHGLWHMDFHQTARRVVTASGQLLPAHLMGIMDDPSRLCCHLQWYLSDTAESLVHALCQAFQKRGLPRAIMTDNGGAMVAAETKQGLVRLSIDYRFTLPYSPAQNGKQESFWTRIESRLIPMLEGVKPLTLDLLNRATIAWVEQEYHQQLHSEIKTTPWQRSLDAPSVGRPCPQPEHLRRVFRHAITRRQRKSDGTVTVMGTRYEVPWRYNSLRNVTLWVARWDMTTIEMVDPRTGGHLATLFPLDKQANADQQRRCIPMLAREAPAQPANDIAPRLKALMAEYAATGLPPAFIPKDDIQQDDEQDEEL